MRKKAFFLVACVLGAVGVNAGTLTVKIGSATWQPGVPVTGTPPFGASVSFVGMGTPDVEIIFSSQVTSTVTVNIFDDVTVGSSADPGLGIGKLIIKGTASRAARINILVADGDQSFPALIDAPNLRAGLTTLGGTSTGLGNADFDQQSHDYDLYPLASGDNQRSTGTFSAYDTDGDASNGYLINASLRGIIIPDPSLRRQTVLAAVVSGDVCPGYLADPDNQVAGRIEVGQVLRLAAVGVTQPNGTLIGGNINAHVIAVARDLYLSYNDVSDPPEPPGFSTSQATTGFRAIESVAAGNALRGKLIAQGRERDDLGADYPPVIVGPPPQGIALLKWQHKQWINRGSIASVRVGPYLLAEGISNDITAPRGRIYSVRSTGQIKGSHSDPANNKVAISAGDGVLEVRISGEDVGGTRAAALAQPLWALINAIGDGASQFQHRYTPDYHDEGVVHLVDTAGPMAGSVTCENLVFDPTITDPRGRGGVICSVDVTDYNSAQLSTASWPSISVAAIAHNVCVLSPVLGQVSIGWQFKGTLVAYGTATNASGPAGDIGNLDIGLVGYVDQVEHEFYPGLARGFVGGYSPPMNMQPGPYTEVVGGVTVIDDPTPPALWSDPAHAPQPLHPMPYDADRWLYARPSHPLPAQDGGSLDSVIRAERFVEGKPHIYQMTQRVVVQGPGRKPEIAPYKPRLEVPSTGTGLIIEASEVANENSSPEQVFGGMYSGVVWSGRLQYLFANGQWGVDTGHEAAKDDFALLPKLFVGRIGPSADIWCQGHFSRGLGDARGPEIGDHVCGEIHVNATNPGWVLLINGKLGEQADWGTQAGAWWDDGWSNTEQSPRGLPLLSPGIPETVHAAHGAVHVWGRPEVSTYLRFEGPVIANGWALGGLPAPGVPLAPDAGFWNGFVRIGDPWDDPLHAGEPGREIITLGPVGLAGTAADQAVKYSRLGLDFTEATLQGPSLNDFVDYHMMGGAVGVVPYALNDADSYPPNVTDPFNATMVPMYDWMEHRTNRHVIGLPENTPRVWLRFYGSIKDNTGEDSVIIERLDPISTPGNLVWIDATSRFHTFVWQGPDNDYRPFLIINPACYDPEDNPGDFAITSGIYRVRNWRVDPENPPAILRDGPRCMHAKGDEPLADFTYYFGLRLTADIGQAGGLPGSDGLIDNNDWIVFINWFFVSDPRVDIGRAGGFSGNDGLWDNNDFVVFIDWFFTEQGGGTIIADRIGPPCPPDEHDLPPNGLMGGEDGGLAGRAGGEEGMMIQGEPAAPESTPAQTVAALQAALQQMIANEPAGPRRDQLQQMLNSLNAAQP